MRNRCPLRMVARPTGQYSEWECIGGGCEWWCDEPGYGCAVTVLAKAMHEERDQLLKTAGEL
jgi:hypothetical protein